MHYKLIAYTTSHMTWLHRHVEPGHGKLALVSKLSVYNNSLTGPAHTVQRFSRAGPRGRGREWATQGVHPLSWLLSNNRLEEVCSTLTKGTFSSRLLLSNQDKGCTPSVAHSLPLPLGPALLNLSSYTIMHACTSVQETGNLRYFPSTSCTNITIHNIHYCR